MILRRGDEDSMTETSPRIMHFIGTEKILFEWIKRIFLGFGSDTTYSVARVNLEVTQPVTELREPGGKNSL